MPKRYETIGYVVAFLSICGFLLGWKFFVARERPAELAEYQRRLNISAEALLAPTTPDQSLKIYSVNVVSIRPFKGQSIGYGIYLGQGLVLTAAHVIGKYPFVTAPHVLVGGQDLLAKVIKEGSFEEIDLALLAVDEERLPVSLRLRRTPICRSPLQLGSAVIVVYPERTLQSQIISPTLIAAQFRKKFTTLINGPQGSGSGVFDANTKCLLGIMSRTIQKFAHRSDGWRISIMPDGYAGYFVPASSITNFASKALGS